MGYVEKINCCFGGFRVNKYPKEVEEDDIKRIRNIKIMDDEVLKVNPFLVYN